MSKHVLELEFMYNAFKLTMLRLRKNHLHEDPWNRHHWPIAFINCKSLPFLSEDMVDTTEGLTIVLHTLIFSYNYWS